MTSLVSVKGPGEGTVHSPYWFPACRRYRWETQRCIWQVTGTEQRVISVQNTANQPSSGRGRKPLGVFILRLLFTDRLLVSSNQKFIQSYSSSLRLITQMRSPPLSTPRRCILAIWTRMPANIMAQRWGLAICWWNGLKKERPSTLLLEWWEGGKALLRQQNQKVFSALPESPCMHCRFGFRRTLQRIEDVLYCLI